MTTLREAAEQALDALEAETASTWGCNSYHPKIYTATIALREALAQPEQDDSCPGCRKGVVCRTPTCGRLKLPVDHPHRSEQPEQEPFVVWNELMARECKQEGLQALSHEQFVRWYADKLKAAHGIKE